MIAVILCGSILYAVRVILSAATVISRPWYAISFIVRSVFSSATTAVSSIIVNSETILQQWGQVFGSLIHILLRKMERQNGCYAL